MANHVWIKSLNKKCGMNYFLKQWAVYIVYAKMIDVINYPGTLSDIENRGLIYVYVICKNTYSKINAKLQTCYAI